MDRAKKVEQILARKAREPIGGIDIDDALSELTKLREMMHRLCAETEIAAQLVPVRAVTLIEVVVRDIIATLVNCNNEFGERSREIVKTVKLDNELWSALRDQSITLGDLVAHEVPTTTLPAIVRALETILGKPLWPQLAAATLLSLKDGNVETEIIVPDIEILRADLAKLFEVRHVIAHELPLSSPCDMTEFTRFLDTAEAFIRALDKVARSELWIFNETQLSDLLARAEKDLVTSHNNVALALEKARNVVSDEKRILLEQTHEAWTAFVLLEARLHAAQYGNAELDRLMEVVEQEHLFNWRADELSNLARKCARVR